MPGQASESQTVFDYIYGGVGRPSGGDGEQGGGHGIAGEDHALNYDIRAQHLTVNNHSFTVIVKYDYRNAGLRVQLPHCARQAWKKSRDHQYSCGNRWPVHRGGGQHHTGSICSATEYSSASRRSKFPSHLTLPTDVMCEIIYWSQETKQDREPQGV
ncbi:hypothetical protein B0H14DRAFT_2751988 [Mycena olivaceomarginata]|nr:hypothetical protein B0H14DRAFT_2751988 [Mycena olivaceomarginata]